MSGRKAKRRVWAVVRPAAVSQRVKAKVQFRRSGTSKWKTVKTVKTRGKRNVLTTTVRLRGRGDLRVAALGFTSRTERIF